MTTAEEFRQRAQRIAELLRSGKDPERAHGEVDTLARQALELIAQGHGDSRQLATIAAALMNAPGERWTA